MPEHLVSTAALAAAEAERDQWRDAAAALAAAYLADAAQDAAPPSPAVVAAVLRDAGTLYPLGEGGWYAPSLDALADAVLGLWADWRMRAEPPAAMDEEARDG